MTRQLENHVINGADSVAVICEGLRSDLIGRGVKPGKITVSPNGVDLELFGEPSAQSFYDYEGLDDLIEAIPLLQASHPQVHLLLVGGGPMEEPLKSQGERLGIGSAVTFTGRVPHGEVERYYGLMDIMVYPRKAMRLTDLVTSLKPLEAMAQGRLVAASDVGGHRELIEDGITGTLFPAGDPGKVAEKLAGLLDNRRSWPQTIEIARKFVEADRNWSSNILRYTPVYQRLIARKPFERAA